MNLEISSNPILPTKIDPEYSALISQIGDDEYRALIESIRDHGLLQPIILNQDRTIIDGHNRYRACQELGVTPKFIVLKFPNRGTEKIYAIESNLVRRHVGVFRKIEIALLLEPIEEQRARARQLRNLKNVKDTLARSLAQNEDNDGVNETEVHGSVIELLAGKVPIGVETFRKGRHLARKAPQELLEKLRKDEITIHAAYEQLIGVHNNAAAMAAAQSTQRHDEGVRSQSSSDSNRCRSSRKQTREVTLSSELFESTIQSIEVAKATGKTSLRLTIEKNKVVFVENY
jgi:ParB-like chromosome segregation protein Spo0J